MANLSRDAGCGGFYAAPHRRIDGARRHAGNAGVVPLSLWGSLASGGARARLGGLATLPQCDRRIRRRVGRRAPTRRAWRLAQERPAVDADLNVRFQPAAPSPLPRLSKETPMNESAEMSAVNAAARA